MASYIEYEDPVWTYVSVPAYSYDEEPIGFFINPRDDSYTYSGVRRSYDDNLYGIRRRRYALEDSLRLDDGYTPFPRRRSSVSPSRRRSRSCTRDYVPVTAPENVASVPVFRKAPSVARYARQLRFDRSASWAPFVSLREDHYTADVDLKADALNRILLKRDLDTTLRSLYANKGKSEVRSKRDFDLSELQRLDRKQDQMSKYLLDFKRDIIRAKHPSQYRYRYY